MGFFKLILFILFVKVFDVFFDCILFFSGEDFFFIFIVWEFS